MSDGCGVKVCAEYDPDLLMFHVFLMSDDGGRMDFEAVECKSHIEAIRKLGKRALDYYCDYYCEEIKGMAE